MTEGTSIPPGPGYQDDDHDDGKTEKYIYRARAVGVPEKIILGIITIVQGRRRRGSRNRPRGERPAV